jgi:hypothetical protein
MARVANLILVLAALSIAACVEGPAQTANITAGDLVTSRSWRLFSEAAQRHPVEGFSIVFSADGSVSSDALPPGSTWYLANGVLYLTRGDINAVDRCTYDRCQSGFAIQVPSPSLDGADNTQPLGIVIRKAGIPTCKCGGLPGRPLCCRPCSDSGDTQTSAT